MASAYFLPLAAGAAGAAPFAAAAGAAAPFAGAGAPGVAPGAPVATAGAAAASAAAVAAAAVAAAASSASDFIADGATSVTTVKSPWIAGTTPDGSLMSLMWMELPASRPFRSTTNSSGISVARQ